MKKPCKHHGSIYQHFDSSALCVHPGCIKSLLLAHGKAPSIKKMLGVIQQYDALDDAINYCIERLLLDDIKGKEAVINRQWLWYALKHFIRTHMIELHAGETIEDVQESLTSDFYNPEKIFFAKELLEIIKDKYGSTYALYYAGELSLTELKKVEALTTKEIKVKLSLISDTFIRIKD